MVANLLSSYSTYTIPKFLSGEVKITISCNAAMYTCQEKL